MSELLQERIIRDLLTTEESGAELRRREKRSRECEVCERKEEALAYVMVEVEVSLCRYRCSCGHDQLYRVVNESKNGVTEVVEWYCSGCGKDISGQLNDAPSKLSESNYPLNGSVSVLGAETVTIDKIPRIQTRQFIEHHTSYVPERIIDVCENCHGKIHRRDGFRDDLLPDMTRKEWEKMGKPGEMTTELQKEFDSKW